MTNLPREQSGSGDTVPEAPQITDFKDRKALLKVLKILLERYSQKYGWTKSVLV